MRCTSPSVKVNSTQIANWSKTPIMIRSIKEIDNIKNMERTSKYHPKKILAGIFILISLVFVACDPKIDPLYINTYTGELVYSYLKKDTTDSYSEFVKYVDKAGLKGMLSAYGEYTCPVSYTH